jgi:hypothetical protein
MQLLSYPPLQKGEPTFVRHEEKKELEQPHPMCKANGMIASSLKNTSIITRELIPSGSRRMINQRGGLFLFDGVDQFFVLQRSPIRNAGRAKNLCPRRTFGHQGPHSGLIVSSQFGSNRHRNAHKASFETPNALSINDRRRPKVIVLFAQ